MDKKGLTPMDYAIEREKSPIKDEIIELLKSSGGVALSTSNKTDPEILTTTSSLIEAADAMRTIKLNSMNKDINGYTQMYVYMFVCVSLDLCAFRCVLVCD